MDPSQMMFPIWGAPPPAALQPPSEDHAAAPNAQPQPFLPPPNPNPNRGWKRKNPAAAYQPPALGDLQVQNRAKARRWFKNNGGGNPNQARKYFFPKNKNNKAAAPRNTTSFIIRAKRAGGIASLVSPCPVTPAVLPTPRLSPSREGLADMAQAQWGVDGYGSMKGLIRLRSSPQPANPNAAASDDDDEGNSSGSDVEEHVEVERRLDHDLSRFEMVYPGRGEDAGGYVLEDEDDAHVARLEEENLTLKERLFLMEQEVGDMRRRLEALEARFSLGGGVGGGENEVEEAPPQNDAERIHIGSENSSEDDVERVRVGSEKGRAQAQGAMGLEKSGGDDTEEQGAAHSEMTGANGSGEQDGVGVLEKTDVHNAEKQQGAMGSDKTGGADEQDVVVGVLGKTGAHNAEKQQGAMGSEKTGGADEQDVVVGVLGKTDVHNAEKQQGAMGSDKTGGADEQDVVVGVLGKTGALNAEKQQGVVGTEKTGEHSIEMVDSALEEKMDEDNGEDEVRLAQLRSED